MGNCIALSSSTSNREISTELPSKKKKILRVVKMDGKVVEYRASVMVRDLLSNFEGHGIGFSRNATRVLLPDYELSVGSVYNLLPLGVANKKDVERCKRIRVVLNRQQFKELLLSKSMSFEDEKPSSGYERRWKPKLEMIEETSE